jgi:tRNA G18 (ribose-2'-O)-methylase SpoU
MSPMPSAESIWDVAVPDRLAVVLGAEGPGLDRRTLARATRTVRIPLHPDVDSLNVGHAAAVTFAAIGRPTLR